MSGIDNRIVTMQFNNRQFEQNAHTTLSTLQKLKSSMNFGSIVGGTIRGLGTISNALSKIGLKTPFAPMIRGANTGLTALGGVLDKLGLKNPFRSGMQGAADMQRGAQQAAGGMGVLDGAVTGVSSKFVALATVAITALTNITNRAIAAGGRFAKSFTFGPVIDGLHEYETNLKAIQTVQANTDRPLPEINNALEELNRYSDQTIYNFGEMAKNVGTFTAAGVDLKTSVSSIKGIANMAALSGSSSEQAAGAMYQLSQAIASGKVGLMDWNSVVNAGMGGKKLQGALAQTAVAMGKIDAAQVKGTESGKQLTIMGKSFRESIMSGTDKPWLSSEVLTNSLAVLDGRFSAAALSQEELKDGTLKYSSAAEVAAAMDKSRAEMAKKGVKYTDEQFAALQKLSTAAFKSATEVKTLGQVFSIAKETIASGWSASFVNIFGNLKQAKSLFTGMSEGLGEILKGNARARNEVLSAWSKGGGRADMIEGLKNAWQALMGLLGPIKEGFRDIFPKKTADDLMNMSENFKNFTESLIPGKATMENIRDIAGGFFAVFSIAGQVFGAVVDGVQAMFGAMGGGGGNFLDFAGGIGNAIKEFDRFLEKSGFLTAFFEGLGKLLAVPLRLISNFAGVISNIFSGFDGGAANKVASATGRVSGAFEGLSGVGDRVRQFFAGVGEMFSNIGSKIAESLGGIGDAIANSLGPASFDRILKTINTALLGGIVLMMRNFFKGGMKVDVGGGLFDSIKETLGGATDAFASMQKKLNADVLTRLAIAIGLMAGALLILSTIDPGKLTKALTAMSAGFGVLIAAMGIMMKVLGPVGIVSLYATSAAMVNMSFAILALAGALKVMASINFGDMLRGLLGLSLMLKIITKAMLPLAAGSAGMLKAAAALVVLGLALNILAVALKIFASMSLAEMAKGLFMLAGTLFILTKALAALPAMQAQAAGLLALGGAMVILAVAMKIFATMSIAEMAKGLIMLAGSLNIIAAAITRMPPTMIAQAAALVLVAGAMVILSTALKVMGSMSWEAVAKGLIVLAGSLTILAMGLNAIGLTGFAGAAALLVAAGALAILTPVLVALGAMSWESIIKGLVTLAATFTILGVAGYLLAPVIPIILGLGAAILLIGAGAALAGAGLLAAATGISMLVAAGSAGTAVMIGALRAIINLIPQFAARLAQGLIIMVKSIGRAAPQMVNSFSRILSSMLRALIKNIPLMGKLFDKLITTGVKVINNNAPKIIGAGFKMIIAFMRKIEQNIGRITRIAANIVIKFMNAIGAKAPALANSAAKMIIRFVNATASAIDRNSAAMGRAGARLGLAIIRGIASGISGAAGAIKDAAMAAARNALDAAKDFFKVGSPSRRAADELGKPFSQGVAMGIRQDTHLAVEEVGRLGQTVMSRMSKAMEGVNDAFTLDPNLNPTVTPVLDLSALTQEANKMSSILQTAPIIASASFQTASDISAMTRASDEADDGSGGGSGDGGPRHLTLEQHLHSPKPIDSVEAYRAGKSLISLTKEALP